MWRSGRGVWCLPPAAVDAHQAVVAHQPGDPFAADMDVQAEPELGMHAWRAVGAPAAGVDLADLFAEIGVRPASAAKAGARSRRSSPRVPHPARDIAGRPGGVASPRRSTGNSSPVTGLPCEENRGLAEDLALLAQIPILPAQAAQLITLDSGEAIATTTCVQIGLANPLRTAVSVRSSSLATWPTVLPVERISSTTSALYSGGKNRRGRGIGLPSRGQGPHLGCPPDRVNSITGQPEP